MATRPSVGSTLWGAALNTWLDVGHEADGTNKSTNVGVQGGTLEIPNLAAGSDLTSHTFYASFYAWTMTRIGILTHGSPTGIDDSNTVVITVVNELAQTLITKTYNLATQPPSSAFADLGTLAVTAFNASGYLKITVTQGTTADMPAFAIVLE